MATPPPPPPHAEAPKTTAGGGSGLPTGKYDIFVIPEHSAGSGFLYLPSLRTNTNSFIAGFASALIMVVLGQSMAPAFQAWWANFQGMGNAGILLLVIAVGLGAWSLGRQQSTESPGAGAGANGGFYSPGAGGGAMPGGGGFSSAGSTPRSAHSGSTPNGGPQPSAHSQAPPGGSQSSANKSNGSYQRPPQPHPQPEPQPQARREPEPETEPEPAPQPPPPPPPPPQPSAAKPKAETPKSAWEKARDEVRRTEEERKAKQAEDKRRADAAARLKELRQREARERAAREAERQRREAEEKEKKEKEAKEARAKELRERLVREREDRRKKLEEEKRLRKQQEELNESRKSSAYAYSGVGEKTNPWPAGKPPTASPQAGKPTQPPSPTKNPPAPTASTFTEEETYSYRPYDQPKRPAGSRMSNSDMSESSWAPSQSTARTTPPPSVRGHYSTKDPDKIVIKAVYCFMNQYAKTPASQLISGVGSVTDGLILRITTEGLFIDDDVRGVAQREWDVKAWTLKNVEVWCPVHFLACAIAANFPPSPTGATPPAASAKSLSTAFFAKTMGGTARLRAAERGAPKTLSGGDADDYLTKMLACCKDSCRLGDCASKFGGTNDDASSVASGSTRTNSTVQTGDWKARGLHLLRATIRDMDGKRYMFVIGEEEGWKVAVGLQRLRKGSQVRSLGVAGLSGIDTKNTLEMLGWGG
ncbi:unnamed protein product [Discula destructiva]